MQDISSLCTCPPASKEAFERQCRELDESSLAALVGAFQYLKSLGLELWNEEGMRLLPLDKPGHMALSSNTLAQLHVLEGMLQCLLLRLRRYCVRFRFVWP
jgi:hypothetical protein